MNAPDLVLLRQHLIDPEICIRCNTCEAICPQQAITHDARNYVVDAAKCKGCNDCLAPCPTGAIDNYRSVPRHHTYPLAEQLGWDSLPAELSAAEWAARLPELGVEAQGQEGQAALAAAALEPPAVATWSGPSGQQAQQSSAYGANVPPWSAAHPYTNLYGPKAAEKSLRATVVGNVRVTEVGQQSGHDYDTHHIVLDCGSMPFPVLEGQSIGIIPPGVDADGRPHRARQYSVASPRNGERPGYNNLSLTVKRVLQDHSGQALRGVASNYLCDLQVGDKVQVLGPFGSTFLMPNHPKSHIVMICTGTGSAPMRAMTERRRRLRAQALAQADRAGAAWESDFQGGKLILFFGARTQQELPYFGPLQNLPKDFIDIHFAFSRTPGQPKRYVQHAMADRAADLAWLLADPDAYFYVCGLKAMEEGVLTALGDIAQGAGLDWAALSAALKREGRLHLETY